MPTRSMTTFYWRTWKRDWSYQMKVRIVDRMAHRRTLVIASIPRVCFRDLVILVIYYQRRSSSIPCLFGSGRLVGGGGGSEWEFFYFATVSQSLGYLTISVYNKEGKFNSKNYWWTYNWTYSLIKVDTCILDAFLANGLSINFSILWIRCGLKGVRL